MQNKSLFCILYSTLIFGSVNAVTTKKIVTSKVAAHQGNVQAAFNLGNIYANGIGVSQNYAEAEKWFRIAAVQGDTKAQYALGMLFYTGKGLTKDYAEAVKWFRLAANQGDAEAKSALKKLGKS
jgi:uncharacterized protein